LEGVRRMGSERVEIITRAERRRRWSMADKLRLVVATRQPGATVAGVAREHGVSESLLYHWRGRLAATASAGLGGGSRASDFIPVCVVDGRLSAVTLVSDAAVPAATIEIHLPNGCRVRVHERIAATTLRKVVAVLGGLGPGC
jgi:transposase